MDSISYSPLTAQGGILKNFLPWVVSVCPWGVSQWDMGLTWRTGGDCPPKANPTKLLASTLALPPDLPKIFKKISQGATPEHRTLPLPNFARCNTTTSHLATLSHCTLQHRAIAPCHFRPSHLATQTARFRPQKSRHRRIIKRDVVLKRSYDILCHILHSPSLPLLFATASTIHSSLLPIH